MIELKRLQKVIEGSPVLDIDRLTVRPGEIVALVHFHEPGYSRPRLTMNARLPRVRRPQRMAGETGLAQACRDRSRT